MQIRLTSVVIIAGLAAALTSCDGPTAPERTLTASFASGVGPNAPANLTATAVLPARINLAWTSKSHNETAFQIYRSNGGTAGFYPLTTTSANVTNYSDVALQPVIEHCYYVEALAKNRSIGVSSTACAKPPVKPPAASSASATTQGSTVSITWTDNSIIESGFRIENAPSAAGVWTASGTPVTANITSAQRSAATEVETCYRVVAYNEFGDADPSNPTCVTPLAAPALSANGGQYDLEINLAWSDNSAEEWYEISRSVAGGEWQVFSGVTANVTEYLDVSLGVGTEYSYRVRAIKGSGFSDYSNVATATAVNARPRAPAWVGIYVFGSTAVEVYWDVPYAYWEGTSSITGWKVERSISPFTTWTIVDPANTSGYYDDYELTPDETVCYQVTALSAYGNSDPSIWYYGCATPTDYYGGGAGNASIGASGIGSLLNRQTPLLDFGAKKSPPWRPRGAATSRRPIAPLTTRPVRAR